MSSSLQFHGLYSPWNSLGQNTGMGSLSFLQGIFPTQGSNPGLPHCRWILYQLSHKESPRILEWIAYPFSSRSSRPKHQTGVSCITCGFFINLATREVWACILSHFNCVQLCTTPWTVARQGPLLMGFSRQEYCSGLPLPSPKGAQIVF